MGSSVLNIHWKGYTSCVMSLNILNHVIFLQTTSSFSTSAISYQIGLHVPFTETIYHAETYNKGKLKHNKTNSISLTKLSKGQNINNKDHNHKLIKMVVRQSRRLKINGRSSLQMEPSGKKKSQHCSLNSCQEVNVIKAPYAQQKG